MADSTKEINHWNLIKNFIKQTLVIFLGINQRHLLESIKIILQKHEMAE